MSDDGNFNVTSCMNFQLLQSYGRGGEIAVNNKEDQEIAVLALHLLQIWVVSLRCLDELDLSVGTGILFQATDQEIELAPYMTVVQ